MEDITKDLKFLGIQNIDIESLTINDAKTAYHKMAKKIHPDKTDQSDLDKVRESNEAFKEAGACYERILKYIVEKLKAKNDKDEVFVQENFGKFNFPCENQGSFTVLVQDNLADAWQESLTSAYGEPFVRLNNKNTVCDRIWKVMFSSGDTKTELTVHFYNHNKPKDKKQSKILVQGSTQSAICDFVFGELPHIYEMVLTKQSFVQTPLKLQMRRRLSTSVKKRNIRHKPKELSCEVCQFKSVSNVKRYDT